MHGIQHLGQDLRETNCDFPPIWQRMAAAGLKVGVAGSLQSFPIPKERASYSFYIPDTYSLTPDTIPASISRFQDINLKLTKLNSRNVSQGIEVATALGLATSLPKLGLSLSTALGIGRQLLHEVTDKTKLNRRRAIQSALYFDVFYKQLSANKPDFSTFFTNHVAASMHRFWAASFNDDYEKFNLPANWVSAYASEIEWSMELADSFLLRLMKFCSRDGDCRIVVASSMGQAATTAEIREGLFVIKDLPKFFGCLGIAESEIRPAMAMAPDVSVHLLTERAVECVSRAIPSIQAAFGAGNIDIDIDKKNMLHMTIAVEPNIERPLPRPMLGNREFGLEEMGFKFVPDQNRVACTAYHIPKGVAIIWEPSYDNRPSSGRSNLLAANSTALAPALMRAHNLELPDYMTYGEIRI
jgi:hypothetical protein